MKNTTNNGKAPFLFGAMMQVYSYEIRRDNSFRGTLILMVAWIEDTLEKIIYQRCVINDKDDKFLNRKGFSAKIRLAYRCGIISKKMKQILIDIADIRNDFAHVELKNHKLVSVKFENKDIQREMSKVVKQFDVTIAALDNYLKFFEDGLIGKFQMVLAMLFYYFKYCSGIEPISNHKEEVIFSDDFKDFLQALEDHWKRERLKDDTL